MIEEACARAGRRGVKATSDQDAEDDGLPVPNPMEVGSIHTSAPEHSHPSESQSNGRAERDVEAIEDQILTCKAAFETRFKVRLASDHPAMAWLIEHAAYLLSKYQLGTDGRTRWGNLHGKETQERICEFGGCILWYVPKKIRAKLDTRWRYGFFLGRSMASDQNYMGMADG